MQACQCPDMGDFVYPRHGCIQDGAEVHTVLRTRSCSNCRYCSLHSWKELMLKEAAWTAKFIRRQREEEAEAGSTLRSIVQHSTAPAATDATLKPPFWKERALQQQRSKWEQQAEESGAAAPLALLRELL